MKNTINLFVLASLMILSTLAYASGGYASTSNNVSITGTFIVDQHDQPIMAFDNQVIPASPQSIIITPNPSPSFGMNLFLDKDPSGTSTPSYRIGEHVQIGVSVSESAYIYIFAYDPTGKITQILPNRLAGHGNNYVHAGQAVYFPEYGAPFNYTVQGPRGWDRVFAVASKEALTSSTLSGFQYEGDFAVSYQDLQSFALAVEAVVKPVAQDSWVSDHTAFYIY